MIGQWRTGWRENDASVAHDLVEMARKWRMIYSMAQNDQRGSSVSSENQPIMSGRPSVNSQMS
jgi:hypothetical protein